MPRRLVLLLLLASGCADDPPVDVRTRLATVGKAYDIEILAADPTFPVRVTGAARCVLPGDGREVLGGRAQGEAAAPNRGSTAEVLCWRGF